MYSKLISEKFTGQPVKKQHNINKSAQDKVATMHTHTHTSVS